MTRDFSGVLASAVDASLDAIVVINRAGAIVSASNGIQRYVGARPVEGEPFSGLAPLRLRELFQRFIAEYFDAPSPRVVGAQQPVCFLTPDGSERRVEIALNLMRSHNDLLIVANIRDVSDRLPPEAAAARTIHRLERRLQNALSELHVVVEHTPAAVALLDRQLRYVLASQRWISDFNLEPQIVGKSHLNLFPNLPERWTATLRRCLAGETLSSDEDSFDQPDGTREYLRWEVIPWRLVDGSVGGITIFSEMITRRKLAEAAVRNNHAILERVVADRTLQLAEARDAALRADAAKTGLIAAASHDLKQPLHAIALLMETLKWRTANAETEAICEKVETVVSNAETILDALLDVSRLETGALRADIRSTALPPILKRILTTHAPHAAAKGLLLELETHDVNVLTDAALLERILDNFVGNATKYTEKGGIRIFTRLEQGEIRIAVSDTGCGIPARDLTRIFSPYVQLSNPSGESSLGYGLGLAICKTIADALGHSLSVESTVGLGSTFSIAASTAENLP